MNQRSLFLIFLLLSGLYNCQQRSTFHDHFVEDFNDNESPFFEFHSGGRSAEFTRTFGAESPTDPGTTILSFKIDPDDVPGAGKGPEIVSKKYTHFGTYAARLRVPDPREIQPDVGAVVGYFTYHMDDEAGLSEIDFEWLIADPEIIYVGTWTGPRGNLRRIGRTINMATGTIYSTSYRERPGNVREPLTGLQNQPEEIDPIEGYDASSGFYTYGFDWYPDRLRWWMLHPQTADTVVLWDYKGSMRGIPLNQTLYRLNFWHTEDWPVETNPNSIEKPLQPFELQIDWMSYDPM